MRPSKEQVVLENLLTAAIDAAMKARARADTDPAERARMMAYYDVIRWAKEQAGVIELEFADRSLADFNPDELLQPARQAA